MQHIDDSDIAIIGMAIRVPDANTPEHSPPRQYGGTDQCARQGHAGFRHELHAKCALAAGEDCQARSSDHKARDSSHPTDEVRIETKEKCIILQVSQAVTRIGADNVVTPLGPGLN